jgi:UDP-N-acetylmuramoyl-tripeptide--D-alanyl-D-alanine ligase
LRPEHQFAVIEMGANQLGEIAYLTKIVQPTVAMITNINASHLAGFGSFEGVSNEKSDIFIGLNGQGIAAVNQDETYSRSWKSKIGSSHVVSYGIYNRADVMAERPHFGPEGVTFSLHTPIGNREIAVPLLGEHIIQNALAAAAATLSVGATLDDVAQGLASTQAVDGRFKPYRLPNGAILVDDAYNASASAVKNAMQTLSKFAGRRIFVMSNMGELGSYAEQYHADMGRWAVEYGLHHLLLTGNSPELLRFTLMACDERAEYFATKLELGEKLKSYLNSNAMVVIKGSRSNRMEEVVSQVLESFGIAYQQHH